MSITFLLFLDHYFLKDEKKYTRVVRKWSRSVSRAPTVSKRGLANVHVYAYDVHAIKIYVGFFNA